MDFFSYSVKDGFFSGHQVVLSGPLQPGTLVTFVPTVRDVQLRHGLVIALTDDGLCHVAWNCWQRVAGIPRGELMFLMGRRR